jgi:BirA family biotin operon repressor/biotin-[acetyl-CoA-carboxylase] ligase
MSVKEDVLKILIDSKGEHFSGEELAKRLNVSRNAIWKAVKSLVQEGYKISGVNNKGYCMTEDSDILSKDIICKYIDDDIVEKVEIEVFKTIDSTNTQLKNRALQGENEWKVIVAEEQTLGRGRMNRKFYSPSGTGIYMSILLRPDTNSKESLFITTMAAVAVAEALENVAGIETGIKWVNDIYCNGKKVCGILTEASMDLESGKLDYAVLGIGINVKAPEEGFPDDIKNIATAICEESEEYVEDLRCKIVANVINNINKYYSDLENHTFMAKYKEKSILIGKEVYVVGDKEKEMMLVEDIDENAALVVRHKDGRVGNIFSGEVSVRIG